MPNDFQPKLRSDIDFACSEIDREATNLIETIRAIYNGSQEFTVENLRRIEKSINEIKFNTHELRKA